MPARKQWKITLDVDKDLDSKERVALASEVIEFIKNRTTKKHLDKNGELFPEYTVGYTTSLDFKNAGKSRAVNLTLSGDLLASMGLLAHRKGAITIGFDEGLENDKAEGNIIGSYGKPKPNPSKARDFLGIEDDDLLKLQKRIKKKKTLPEDFLFFETLTPEAQKNFLLRRVPEKIINRAPDLTQLFIDEGLSL